MFLDTTPAAGFSVAHNRNLEEVRRAEESIGDNLFNREVVPVPSPIVENAEHDVIPLAGGNHRVRLGGVHRHDFVSDEVFACIHRFDGEFGVCIVRRGKHNELHRVVREDFVKRLVNLRVGICLACGGAPLSIPRSDGVKIQSICQTDKIGMKRAAGIAVTDYCSVCHKNSPLKNGKSRGTGPARRTG